MWSLCPYAYLQKRLKYLEELMQHMDVHSYGESRRSNQRTPADPPSTYLNRAPDPIFAQAFIHLLLV
jgi:hypothetical protein